MGDLLRTIGSSVGPVGNITLILGIIVYMFAVVGMNIFGKAYTEEAFGKGKVPRWNFNDFGHSFMMIFRILCGKWIEPLWWTMRATDDIVAIIFILPVFVIGNFIILNLFLAVLLNSFGGNDEEEEDEEKKKKEKEKKTKKKSRLNISKLLFRSKSKSGSRTRVGPEGEENSEDEKADEYRMICNDEGDENENKKNAANTLSNPFSTSNEGVEKGSDLEMCDVMANGKNSNGVKHPPGMLFSSLIHATPSLPCSMHSFPTPGNIGYCTNNLSIPVIRISNVIQVSVRIFH